MQAVIDESPHALPQQEHKHTGERRAPNHRAEAKSIGT
jgi:hypothetical protein